MKSHLVGQGQIRKLTFASLAVVFALASVACGAAPDGDPSHEPASANVTSDQVEEDGGVARVAPAASTWWTPADPTPPEPAPGGGSGGGAPHQGKTRE